MEKLYYTTIDKSFQYEIPKIKGSRFFATLIPVNSKEECEEKLTLVRKEYFDATHNCYAWRIGVDANQDLFGSRIVSAHQERANDDGEPSNTAGKPILSVLNGKNVQNVLCVVTRYFGGTLLGVGGLIQAYTESTKACLEYAPFVKKEITRNLNVKYSYEQVSTLQYLYSKYETKVIEEKYDQDIQQNIAVNIAYYDIFMKELIDKQISYN